VGYLFLWASLTQMDLSREVAFDRGGAKDGVDLPILDKLALLLQDLEGTLFTLVS